jgi:DNA-binding MarR family transcriptional regulator
MNIKDIKTLLLLEAIDNEECLSQRELSKRLSISLGMVNATIKRLLNQGYFKLVTLPKSKVKYVLTPKGLSEKADLAIRYISYLTSVYKETKTRIQTRLDKLYEDGIHKIALYGGDEVTEIACMLPPNNPSQKIVAILDEKKEGQKVNGVSVCSENKLKELSFDAVIITETKGQLNAREKLIDIQIPAHKIVNLF